MKKRLRDAELAEALETCASEPVHIPGIVQSFGALVGFDPASGLVSYASDNCVNFLGVAAEQLLGEDLRQVVGTVVIHSVKNALSRPEAKTQSIHLGDHDISGKTLSLHCFASAGLAVIEFEPARETIFAGADGLKALRLFIESVGKCTAEQELHQLTTQLLRHITGFHRVMVYKFDEEYNGEVLAEDRRSDMPSFVGLQFPHWDIPPQARDMMRKLPLRMIPDTETQSPALLQQSGLGPLDISLAATRGVSQVHMEYLRNMNVQATMTLTVMLQDRLWGIISFHHNKPRVPPASLREILVNITQIFSSKLLSLQQQARLALIASVESLKDEILEDAEGDVGMRRFLASVCETLSASGVVIVRNGFEHRFGQLPETGLIESLKSSALEDSEVQKYECFSEAFPEHDQAFNGLAGALVYGPEKGNCLLAFREPVAQQVAWAGNPEKTVETVSDRLRLSPRGSFSTYLQQVEGHAAPWTEDDIYFANRFWNMISTVERRELIASLNRQQKIMINELNHRGRNILALVKSVSKQAKNSAVGSLESYARSLEARIQALADSHEIASAGVVSVVAVQELIRRELLPFLGDGTKRFSIEGSAGSLRAEVAPIVSLVIHELVTNAVKYGALSNDVGTISIVLENSDEGLNISWREHGGPTVQEPQTPGFGSTLIRQAIPYELDGRAQQRFAPTGVEADLFLPQKLFDAKILNLTSDVSDRLPDEFDEAKLVMAMAAATCLLVEDNFMIAKAAQDEMMSLGLHACDTVGDLSSAMDYLENCSPTFAVLDINLGQGETSYPIAQKLIERGIPFVFVTGYGEFDESPVILKSVTRLTKPVSGEEMRAAIAGVLL